MRAGLVFALLAIPCAGVIVDRIAISLGTQVITDSEIDQRIRLSAFENGVTPDFSLASRKLAASRLIDEKLVEHEMTIGRYPGTPEDKKPALLAAYEKNRGPAEVTRQLAVYGLAREDLMNDLARQQDLLTFLSLRFRPAVQVSEQDVQNYYRQHFAESKLQLNELRGAIEKKITDDRADAELDQWLKDHRERTRITYLEKDLEP